MRSSAIVLAAVALLGASVTQAGQTKEQRAVSEGRALYIIHCASCHGPLAQGTGRPGENAPDLTLMKHRDGTFSRVHAAVHVANVNHRGPMPRWHYVFGRQYRVLPELQIWKLARYIESIQRAGAPVIGSAALDR